MKENQNQALPDLFHYYAYSLSITYRILLPMYKDELEGLIITRAFKNADEETQVNQFNVRRKSILDSTNKNGSNRIRPQGTGSAVENRLLQITDLLLKDYVSKTRGPEGAGGAGAQISEHFRRLLQDIDPVLCLFLRNFRLDFSDKQCLFQLSEFYFPLTDLIEFGSPTIRRELRQLFATRVESILPFPSLKPETVSNALTSTS